MIKISPSVLSCDFSRMGEEFKNLEHYGADWIHIDVMDGHFVPNITLGAPIVKALRKCSELTFDVHLMISDPYKYAPDFIKAGADVLCFHVEADSDVEKTVDLINSLGCTPALALKPATPAEAVFPYLDKIGMVLVMTVEPGFGGQSFMEDQIPKVAAIFAEIKKRNLPVFIEVDGGIDAKTAPGIVKAGADVLVAGTGVFRAPAGMKAAAGQLLSLSELLPAR